MKIFISYDHYRNIAAFSTKSVSISSRLHLLKKAAGRPDGPDEPDGFWALALSVELSLALSLALSVELSALPSVAALRRVEVE